MSSDGQAVVEAPVSAAVVYDLPAHTGFETHVHDEHQLTWAERGVLLIGVAGASWAIPRSRALWIPGGVSHSVMAASRAVLHNLWITPQRCPGTWTEPRLLAADGLVGELLVHLLKIGPDGERRAVAEALLWDVLEPVPVTSLTHPMPDDDRARRIAEAVRADVTNDRALAAWGQLVGASERTLARLFLAETGISFGRWRTRARLASSLPLLAGGASVGTVAHRVGYASSSAYVAAFHREIGITPARYFGTGAGA